MNTGSWIELPRSKLRGIEGRSCERLHSVTPEFFSPGVQIRIGLDSRLKRAGMTRLFGLAVAKTQQAAGNQPQAIEGLNQEFGTVSGMLGARPISDQRKGGKVFMKMNGELS